MERARASTRWCRRPKERPSTFYLPLSDFEEADADAVAEWRCESPLRPCSHPPPATAQAVEAVEAVAARSETRSRADAKARADGKAGADANPPLRHAGQWERGRERERHPVTGTPRAPPPSPSSPAVSAYHSPLADEEQGEQVAITELSSIQAGEVRGPPLKRVVSTEWVAGPPTAHEVYGAYGGLYGAGGGASGGGGGGGGARATPKLRHRRPSSSPGAPARPHARRAAPTKATVGGQRPGATDLPLHGSGAAPRPAPRISRADLAQIREALRRVECLS